MKEIRQSQISGAWFYESGGITLYKGEAAPKKGWKLVELIPGEYKGIEELKDKIDAVLEIHPRCDVLLLGQGDHFDIYDLREYKQKYWLHIEEHIKE